MRQSIKLKILGIVLLSVFLITSVLGWLSFEFSKERLVSMLGDSIKGIASAIASFIEKEDISIILENSEKIRNRGKTGYQAPLMDMSPKRLGSSSGAKGGLLHNGIDVYDQHAAALSAIKSANKIDSPINVYVVSDNRLKIVLTSDPTILIGAAYKIRPEAKEALLTGLPRSTAIYNDKDGAWISAYAPTPYSIDSEDGKALVEINYKVDSYINRLRGELAIIIMVCIFGFILVSFLSYKLISPLVASIIKLDEAAGRLDKEQYDDVIEVRSDDEIGHLSKTFNMLRISIKDKIEELKLSLVREKKAHLEAIVALTNAIEMRDPYTKEHLQRVERYALLIAKEMKLTEPDLEKLKYSCFLHDIGKIYIDTSLLQKVKLSTDDFSEIKKHSERGAKILEGIQFLKDVKEAVLHHQERYDGKGYPDGLKGEEIPFLARIVTVADAFDAMTTDRPYKAKISFDKAMDEIEKNSGTQFDPKVSQAFLKYRHTIEEIARKHINRSHKETS